MDDNTDIVEYLRRNAAFNYKDTYIAAADEIERLRKELNEARRLYCNTMSNVTATYVVHLRKTPKQIAKDMGWDCFQENANA